MGDFDTSFKKKNTFGKRAALTSLIASAIVVGTPPFYKFRNVRLQMSISVLTRLGLPMPSLYCMMASSKTVVVKSSLSSIDGTICSNVGNRFSFQVSPLSRYFKKSQF